MSADYLPFYYHLRPMKASGVEVRDLVAPGRYAAIECAEPAVRSRLPYLDELVPQLLNFCRGKLRDPRQ